MLEYLWSLSFKTRRISTSIAKPQVKLDSAKQSHWRRQKIFPSESKCMFLKPEFPNGLQLKEYEHAYSCQLEVRGREKGKKRE